MALLSAAFGCGPSAPQHLLLLDMRILQDGPERGILQASLLLDDRVVAHFAQGRPERAVVFSRRIDGVAPGAHLVTVRIDAQQSSPTYYVASGFAHYDGKPHPLEEIGEALATGQSLRFRVEL